MRQAQSVSSWVVYRKNPKGNTLGGNVVCGREEWEAIESAQPGCHTLVGADIPTEKEAEKLARGTAGDAFNSRTPRKQ